VSKLYEVVYSAVDAVDTQFQKYVPLIVPFEKIEHVEQNPLTWREAKKKVRQFYLDQAASLRTKKEKDVAEFQAFRNQTDLPF